MVDHLVTPVLLCKAFADRFIKAIFCMDRQVVQIHSRPIPMFAEGDTDRPVVDLSPLPAAATVPVDKDPT